MHWLLLHGRWLLLAALLLTLLIPVSACAVVPVDVQVVVRSSGAGLDAVSFVYSTPAQGAEVRRRLETQARHDFERLAAAFGSPGAPVKVTTAAEPRQAPPTTSAEGKLTDLVNRTAGWLNIGPLLKVFSRYDRLTLTYFAEPPFQFRGPRGPFNDPSLSMALDEGGIIYTYHVRIKHAAGGERALPSFEAPRGGLAGLGKLAYLVVALMALAAGVAVYAGLQYWLGLKKDS